MTDKEAQLKAKLLKMKLAGKLTDYQKRDFADKLNDPLAKKVPFGKEDRDPGKIRDDALDKSEASTSGKKVRPKTPTDADRARIITAKAKVNKLKKKTSIPDEIMQEAADAAGQDKNLAPSYIAQDHKHSIVFKGHRLGGFRGASLNSQSGKFAKYWLLNAKETNGNGWGIAAHTAKDNMKKFIGRPLVVTAKSWHGASEYGEEYEHPYLPTNDISAILRHQDKFRVGSIVDVFEDKNGDWFANIEMLPKFANRTLPPFCSPAIYQLDAKENEGQISKWEALHLAALNENPAYGARIALLKGTCIGTGNECQVQFKSAKLEGKVICTKKLKGRVANLKKNQKIANNFSGGSFGPDFDALDAFKSKKKYKSKKFESTGDTLKLRGHTVARHHKEGIEVSNAGHDTPLTYSTIKGLGIHARNQKGVTKLNNKEIDVNSGEWVLAKHKDISDKPIKYTKTPGKRTRSVTEQSKFRQQVEQNEANVQGRKGKLPLSQINIQPNDQKRINKITGVKSPVGKEILGVDAHHILSYKKNPGLRSNPNNGIMIPKKEHKQLTSFAKLKARLARIESSRIELNNDGAYFLTPEGKHVGPYNTHADYMFGDADLADDEYEYEKYFKESGDIRIGHTDATKRRGGQTTNVIYNTPTTSQIKALHQHEKDNPHDGHSHSYQINGMNGGFNSLKGLRNHLSKNKLGKLKLKLATLGEENMTYQDSKKVKIIKKKHPEVRKASLASEFAHDDIEGVLRGIHSSPLPPNKREHQSSFLSSTGDYIGGGEDHTETIKSIFKDKEFTPEDKANDGPVTRFSTEHGLPRVQRRMTRRGGRVSFGIHSKVNRTQLRTMQDVEKGGEELAFVVGKDTNGTVGEGYRDLTKALRENKFL